MGKTKKVFTIIFTMLCTSVCFARQISFQIVQHDSSASEVTEPSLEIEDELITKFFEQGYIVTNSPATMSESSNQDEELWNAGFTEACNGFSDFFVQVNVYYISPQENTIGEANIDEINWTLASARTGRKYAGSWIKNQVTKNHRDDMKVLTSNLFSEINNAIRANKA